MNLKFYRYENKCTIIFIRKVTTFRNYKALISKMQSIYLLNKLQAICLEKERRSETGELSANAETRKS